MIIDKEIAMQAVIDDLYELSEGNPGAITAVITVASKYQQIDPQAAFGAMHVTMFLKDNNITGSSIWFMYKDVCDQSCTKFVTVMRGIQMGFLERSVIKNIQKQQHCNIDFDDLIKRLKEKIEFNVID